MKLARLSLCATAASFGLALAAHADPLPAPSFTPPLSPNAMPASFDAGPLGKLSVGGAITGLGMYQNHHVPGDHEWQADFSNAQAWIEKTDGPVQFFAEVGGYSFPSLGYAYTSAKTTTDNTFGVLPVGFIKLVPNSHFSIQAGKLPTLIGSEYAFTFQNMNINRGLVWFQEPIISRGVQANFSQGPISLSVAVTDGYYTSRYNSISGLLTFTATPKDTFAVSGGGNVGKVPGNVPFASTQIITGAWTHTEGAWMISPYIQWEHVPLSTDPLAPHQPETSWGGAILAKYTFTPQWSMAGRFEYIESSGKPGPADTTNLLGYGRGSKAWSVTATPTFQKGIYFIRGEASYVKVEDGAGFGPALADTNQFRLAVETGVVF